MRKKSNSGIRVVGWHFINNDYSLSLKHNNKIIKVKPGLKLHTRPEDLEICNNGLHASIRIVDACLYAKGWKLCRVVSSGGIDSHDNKYATTEREVLYIINFKSLIKQWAINAFSSLIRNLDILKHREKISFNAAEKEFIKLADIVMNGIMDHNFDSKKAGKILTSEFLSELNLNMLETGHSKYCKDFSAALYRFGLSLTHTSPYYIRATFQYFIEAYNVITGKNINFDNIEASLIKLEMDEKRLIPPNIKK